MFFKSVLIASLVLLYSINVCESIQCYVCSSSVNPACSNDKFEAKDQFKRNCDTEAKPAHILDPLPGTPKKCSLFVYLDPAGLNVTERQCFWESKSKPEAKCYFGQHQLKSSDECKTCDSDLCNSASKAYATMGITFFIITFMGILMS